MLVNKMDFSVISQKGSHVVLKPPIHLNLKKARIVIPKHDELGKGLLRSIINDLNLSKEDFNKLLKK
jgi:predicted RNA binding protein YcfA (HicA-like mRNA interferase family)